MVQTNKSLHFPPGHALPDFARPLPQPLVALALHGAAPATLPVALPPQLATPTASLPIGSGWVFEAKHDGYRILARIEHGRVRLHTRTGQDWTARLRPLATELESLGIESGWLDGEITVPGAGGRPDFAALQNAFDAALTGSIAYYVFDAPFLGGFDLREAPLQARRAIVREALRWAPGERVRFSEELAADGRSALARARASRLEGIIAKRRDAPYVSRRTETWLKLKCSLRQEFVVTGFAMGPGAALRLRQLEIGYHDARGALRDGGRVLEGWSWKEGSALLRRLLALAHPTPGMAAAAGPVRRVEPLLVAEVAFSEWTPAGQVRDAVFKGLREDKPAADVVLERPALPPRAPARRFPR
jgi:bifunctional non-homologous end joining protein LigD